MAKKSKKRKRKQQERKRRKKKTARQHTGSPSGLSGWLGRLESALAAAAGETENPLDHLPPFPPEIVRYGQRQKAQRSRRELEALAAEHFEVGQQFFALENYPRALPELQKCIAVTPEGMIGSAAVFNLGQCYANLGDFDAARQTLEFYVELEPRDPDAYFPLAQIALEEGRFEDCIELSLKGRKRLRHRRDARGLVNLARAYYELGDMKRSMKTLEEALKLDPNWALAHQCLGACYEDLLDLEKAAYHYGRAAELDPADEIAAECLERVSSGHFIARLLPESDEDLHIEVDEEGKPFIPGVGGQRIYLSPDEE